MSPVELDRERRRRQQIVHHPLVDHVVGEPLVGALDVEPAAELGGLEVNVVVAQHLGKLGEHALGGDRELRAWVLHQQNEEREIVMMRAASGKTTKNSRSSTLVAMRPHTAHLRRFQTPMPVTRKGASMIKNLAAILSAIGLGATGSVASHRSALKTANHPAAHIGQGNP